MAGVSREQAAGDRASTRRVVGWLGLAAGPVLALLVYLLLPAVYDDGHGRQLLFSHAGRATAAAGCWMAVWWMTEAIPVYATALLPLALLPLAAAGSISSVAAPYGHELIFLFMGGFIIALSMQRWGLHRRFALRVLRLVGTRPHRLVGGFMLVSAALSMWVSNTATAMMMLPIAVSVIDQMASHPKGGGAGSPGRTTGGAADNLPLCLMLGIAYAASIGGIGTLIGTPPNLFLASYVKSNLGGEISFVRWMGIGLPFVMLFLPVAWWLLTCVLYPVGRQRAEGSEAVIRDAAKTLGPMNAGEWATLAVFSATAACWILRPVLQGLTLAGGRPFAGLSDAGIAMLGALSLFVIPVDLRRGVFVMNWDTAVRLPWGILVLFGGGLSLAAAVKANGVGEYLGAQVGTLAGLPPLLLVMLVTTLMIFLTELTSNTASTATLVPILASLAPGLGVHPYLLIVPAAIAASCAFMLPVATPPNAIVFAAGHVTIPQMCRAGLWLNLIGILLIAALTWLVAAPMLGFPAGGVLAAP